jgi:hypothetical protein
MSVTDEVVFETATDAFNAHNLDALSARLDENVLFSAPGGIGGAGRADCVAFYRRWLEEFPDAHLEIHTTHVADDVAVEEGTFTGTPTGVAPTGRSVVLGYVQVVRFREGRHVALKLMFDRLQMLEQLGLVRDCEREP